MTKQFAVIGLGNFGRYLSSHLYEKGHDVLAIDCDSEKVDGIKDRVSQAVIADATDGEALGALGIKNFDVVVVCIGSPLSDSIMSTLLVKDLGAKRVFAKAVHESHGRILKKVGADEILFPEKDTAIALAERLRNPNMLDFLPLTEGYSIIQMAPPQRFVGKTLRDLNLINRYSIQVVAVQEIGPNRINLIPTGDFIVKESDALILLGANNNLDELREDKG